MDALATISACIALALVVFAEDLERIFRRVSGKNADFKKVYAIALFTLLFIAAMA